MKIAIGGDHAATEHKAAVQDWLQHQGHEYINYGTDTADSVDYPDYGHPVARAVQNEEVDYGIVICGSGNGINMSVNKHQGIRSALCWNLELAELARLHNNANVLALPARFISIEEAVAIVEVFIKTPFEGGRHQRRVAKIDPTTPQ